MKIEDITIGMKVKVQDSVMSWYKGRVGEVHDIVGLDVIVKFNTLSGTDRLAFHFSQLDAVDSAPDTLRSTPIVKETTMTEFQFFKQGRPGNCPSCDAPLPCKFHS